MNRNEGTMRYSDYEQRQLDIASGLELDRNAARKHAREASEIGPKRFPQTYCSSCGREFGAGNHGYSHCNQHPPFLRLR